MLTWLGNKFHSTAIFLLIPLHDTERKFYAHKVIPGRVHSDLQPEWNPPPAITFYEFKVDRLQIIVVAKNSCCRSCAHGQSPLCLQLRADEALG